MDPAVYQFYERLNQNPEDAEAVYHLWEYHGGRGEFQQLATIVEQTAARRTDPHSAADLFYRAGELWAKNVGRADKAVGSYKRAFELDPGHLPALAAARTIYQQLGNARLAAQLLERELAVQPDMAVRAMLLREGAGLRAQLNDLPGQIAYLEETAKTAADDWEVQRELAGAYIARAASPLAEEADNVRAAQILASLARDMGPEHGLAFAEAALDAYPGDETAYALVYTVYTQTDRGEDLAVRQIAFLGANPTSPLAGGLRRNLANLYLSVGQPEDAIACLQPLAGEDPEVARVLAGLYRQTGRAGDLAGMLQTLAEHADPPQRIQDLRDLAEIFGQQGNRTAMLGAMRDVLALDPADPEALALIEDDLRARGAYGELREVLWGAVRTEHCPVESRLPRLREIAQVSAQRLDDRETAVATWRELLSYDAGDAEALGALEQLLHAGEQWDELAAVLDHRAGTESDPDVRKDVLRRLAEVNRMRRGDLEGESHALTALWALDPDDDATGERLIDVRGALGDPDGAAEVLRARADRASPETAARRWTELAMQRADTGAFDDAVTAWQRVVALEPGNAGAWDALETTLGAAGRHAERFETLSERARVLPVGTARAAIHRRAAAAAQAMGDAVGAIAEARRALEMAPEDPAHARTLVDLLEANGAREELLMFVSERTAAMADGEEKVELLRRAAHATGQVDPHGASELWETLRACSRRAGLGDDAEALDALMGVAELVDDTARLVSLLGQAAEYGDDLGRRRNLAMRRAELQATALHDPHAAIETLQGVLSTVDPGCAPGWAKLAELAREVGDFSLASEALEREVGALTGPDDDDARAAAAAKLVAMTEEDIRDPSAVIHSLEVHHAADPGDFGVIQRLADLCEAAGRYADAVGYLDQLAEVEGDDAEAARLVMHISALSEERLEDAGRAWAVMLPIGRSGDATVLEHLMALATRQGLDAQAVAVFTEVAETVNDPALRARLWQDVAVRRAGVLGDLSGALDAWIEVLKARPGEHAALDATDVLARDVGAGDRGVRVMSAYREVLGHCDDPTAAHELALRGITAVESTGDSAAAMDLGVYALGRAQADDDLLEVVLRLGPTLGRRDEVYVALDKRRRAAQSDAERFGVTLRAVRVASGALDDRDTAFQYMDQAISQAIGRREPDEGLLEEIENTARAGDQTRPEAGLLSGLVERFAALAEEAREDNPGVSTVLLRRAGEVCERDLGLPDHGIALYTRGVGVWPTDERTADRLEAAAGRTRPLDDVVELYQQIIGETYDPAVVRAYVRRRAILLGEKLGRVDEAIEGLQRLIEMSPKSLEAIQSLEELLERYGRWQDLLLALDREMDAGGDRLVVSRRIAGVWETRLHNAYEAREGWKRVLKLAPEDTEARAAIERLERRSAPVDFDDDPMEGNALEGDLSDPLPEHPGGRGSMADDVASDEVHGEASGVVHHEVHEEVHRAERVAEVLPDAEHMEPEGEVETLSDVEESLTPAHGVAAGEPMATGEDAREHPVEAISADAVEHVGVGDDAEVLDEDDAIEHVEGAEAEEPSLDALAAVTAQPSSVAMAPPRSGRTSAPPPLPPRRRE